ncbi:hypothetical protein FRB94_001498 [Tulasnella sp. JGI-2019a]|nr:hypothetical protein FRB94_001498 [Tulasnella sp. JGI-2019a]KAG9007002.1 hypothetical protein FRB93_008268 [Tulasnella sp. JGI-2019a]
MYQQEIEDAGEFWSGYDHTPSSPLSPVAGLHTLHHETPGKSGAPIHLTMASSIPSISVSDASSSASSPSLPESLIEGRETPSDGHVGDDSYWSLYASVGGTADSTHPSPRLPDGKKPILDEYGRPILADSLEEHGKGGQGFVETHNTTWHQVGEASDRFELEEYRKESELDFIDAPQEVQEIEERLLGLDFEPSPLVPASATNPTQPVTVGSSSALAVALREAHSTWLAQNPNGKIDDFLAVVRGVLLP